MTTVWVHKLNEHPKFFSFFASSSPITLPRTQKTKKSEHSVLKLGYLLTFRTFWLASRNTLVNMVQEVLATIPYTSLSLFKELLPLWLWKENNNPKGEKVITKFFFPAFFLPLSELQPINNLGVSVHFSTKTFFLPFFFTPMFFYLHLCESLRSSLFSQRPWPWRGLFSAEQQRPKLRPSCFMWSFDQSSFAGRSP